MDIVTPEHKTVLRQWYEELQKQRGMRASLRRSTSISEACLAPGFHALRLQTHTLWKISGEEWRLTALALVAALGAHVKTNDEKQRFAQQLGNKEYGRRVMSELRFKRLCAAKTPDDLLRQLRRTIHLLKGNVNLPSLADDIFRWCREANDAQQHAGRALNPMEFVRVRWAMDFYQAGEPDDVNQPATAE
ncbi:type I-E CRISPR-associated protein Cse2/CasB [Enterobacter sp.]|uniref:type I-E CRISPR-associated protein Cse2/CasB n=1 Tax=Enterobacter sp. TaxID=42895 RepID=UPI00296EABD3|nr:type I-E CRISPR-associated protein Cse2/CasB [Enterobacter sp.]